MTVYKPNIFCCRVCENSLPKDMWGLQGLRSPKRGDLEEPKKATHWGESRGLMPQAGCL